MPENAALHSFFNVSFISSTAVIGVLWEPAVPAIGVSVCTSFEFSRSEYQWFEKSLIASKASSHNAIP